VDVDGQQAVDTVTQALLAAIDSWTGRRAATGAG
jgi:hypothetical protein